MSVLKRIDQTPTDEATEKALRTIERYCIVSDDDGHKFVIPVAKKIEFDKWLQAGEAEEWCGPTSPDQFSEYRLDGGLLTFTDPRVNQ